MTTIKHIRTCSIWRALDVLGDKPTLLILESYWLGSRRFSAFQKQTGLLKPVISDRLNKLIAADCLEKTLYSERPVRYEYKGTEKFFDLYPVALSMLHWEQKWGQFKGKLKISLIHKTCGKITQPRPTCQNCQSDIDARDVSWSEGPGVGTMPAIYSRRRHKVTSKPEPYTPLFDEIADIIGDRWATLIIRSVFTNLNSFQDICNDTAIATNILSERLEYLCDISILAKKQNLYKLTPKGRDIYPILLSLMEWGNKWYGSSKGPPLLLTHKPCQAPLINQIICSECNQNITMNEIEFELMNIQTDIIKTRG